MRGQREGTFVRRALGVAAGAAITLVITASGAAAQDPGDYVGNPPPVVEPGGGVDAGGSDRDPVGGVDPKSSERSGLEAASGGLALTGADIAGLAAIGAAAVATGATLQWRSRRARRQGVSTQPA